MRVSGQSAHEGAAFGGPDREPIELLRRRGLRSLKPVSVGSFREPSLTTASIPGVSQQKPLLNPFPPADVAAVHRRRQRALSPAQTPEQTPLYRASSSMPILRSLGGSAVSCSSLRAASGAARGARGADRSPNALCLQREERRGPRRGSGVGSSC